MNLSVISKLYTGIYNHHLQNVVDKKLSGIIEQLKDVLETCKGNEYIPLSIKATDDSVLKSFTELYKDVPRIEEYVAPVEPTGAVDTIADIMNDIIRKQHLVSSLLDKDQSLSDHITVDQIEALKSFCDEFQLCPSVDDALAELIRSDPSLSGLREIA
jgi:hypothetical protein